MSASNVYYLCNRKYYQLTYFAEQPLNLRYKKSIESVYLVCKQEVPLKEAVVDDDQVPSLFIILSMNQYTTHQLIGNNGSC